MHVCPRGRHGVRRAVTCHQNTAIILHHARITTSDHLLKRSKHALHSALDEIPSIGPATRDRLLKKFKSVKRIREATLEELAEAVGMAKAKAITEHFGQKSGSENTH